MKTFAMPQFTFFTKGVQYMLFSTVCFTIFQALIKYQIHIPSHEHVLFRSTITWILCAIYLAKFKVSLKGKNTKLLIQRGIVGTISTLSFLYAVQNMPFGSAVTIKYLSPIFTAVIAMLFLYEKIKKIEWLFFVISFIGVVLLKGFDPRIEPLAFSLALLSAFSGGILYTTIRKIGDDDHPLVIVHYFMLIAIVTSGTFSFWEWVTPSIYDLPILLMIGIAGFYGQYYMTLSLQQNENTSYLVFYKYLEAVYALIVGLIFFGESHTFLSFSGILLVFIGLVFMVYTNSKNRI